MTSPAVPHSEAASERPPSFGELFEGMLMRPAATFPRLRDADAWFWPAILMLVGYTAYLLAVGAAMLPYMQSMVAAMFPPSSGQSGVAARQAFQQWMPPITIFSALWQVPAYLAISWAVRTLLFYGLAQAFGGGRPSVGRVVAMIGWAWVPLFLQYLVIGVLMLAIPQVARFFMPLPQDVQTMNPVATQQASWQAQMILSFSPFVIWNLVLCVIGVSQVFELPRWKAALVVLLPTVASAVLLWGWYLFSMAIAGSGAGVGR